MTNLLLVGLITLLIIRDKEFVEKFDNFNWVALFVALVLSIMLTASLLGIVMGALFIAFLGVSVGISTFGMGFIGLSVTCVLIGLTPDKFLKW